MGRKPNTDERRAQIVQGLMLAMAERGYRGASIAHIATAAQLSPGLLHYHFKTKGEILLALIGHLTARLVDFADHATTAEDRVRALIEGLAGLEAAPEPLAVRCWSLIAAEALISPPVGEAFAAAMTTLRDLLEAAVAAARADDPATHRRAQVAAALSLLHGAYLLGQAAPGIIPRGATSKTLNALLLGDAR